MTESVDSATSRPSPEVQEQIVALKDGGASWLEIGQRFGLTRQQARYAYQLGKRMQRRRER